MKKRRNKEEFEENQKSKLIKNQIEKKIECTIDDLPKVLLKYLCLFLDFNSFVSFTSTNKKNRSLFATLREGFLYLKKIGFERNKEIEQKIIKKMDFSLLKKENVLIYACLSDQISTDIIKYFIENKSDLNLKEKKQGNTPIHYALYNPKITLNIINALINFKANLNIKNNSGYSPIEFANSNYSLSKQIIESYGPKYNIKNLFNYLWVFS